ncbi:alpha-amylase family protein [Peterkaempfera bronchialis]|uniref:Enterotoxin n=1 Tax=Peterkaempfera bronchialis TaxID=2126346 RepID=A0A345T2X2_9ACTN|nr:hypothetical protein [Peterkaempfera bronchialis]AXI80327.1 hypothetical protein C7M71_025930 [Peterkaempfera bronchialis]
MVASGLLLALTATGATVTSPAGAAAADPVFAAASGVVFPGTAPGPAHASLGRHGFTLSNAVLSATWSVAGSRVALASFSNAAAGNRLPVGPGELFTLTLADSTAITSSAMTVTSPPSLSRLAPRSDATRLAEREPGSAVTTAFHWAGGGRALDVVWTVELRDGANTVRQRFAITPVSGTFDVTAVRLIDLRLPGSRVLGGDDGSPVAVGGPGAETAFLGVENPLAKATVSGSAVAVSVPRSGALAPGRTYAYTASIGVSPPGQLRRSFAYYVERERAQSRRTFLHYQSWLDLKPPGLVIDGADLTSSIDLFGSELTRRGATVDTFWVDDGWDYLRAPRQADESRLDVWSFDPVQFPTGFAPQRAAAARYGASLSVWMSPFGGYGESATRRLRLNAAKPADQRYRTEGGTAFTLADPRYADRFRSVAFDMMDRQGVRGFKIDGIGGGLYRSGPDAAHLADYQALLDLTREMRDHRPDVWINATVGTWGSPYWLWYVDSVWRDGADASQAGTGSPQQRYVSYRDSQTYRNIAEQNPLFPIPAVSNHGIIFSDRTSQFSADHDLAKPEVRAAVSADIRSYFAQGLALQELYVRNTLVRPPVPGADWFWDTLAANARWARNNAALLADAHWVGGDAATGGIYGTAAWSSAAGASRGVLMLRNPSGVPQTFRVDPQAVFALPPGVGGGYRFTEKDGLHQGFDATRGRAAPVTLKPYEVAVFEAVPTG